MAKRDIIVGGVKIGELDLPNGTPESVWADRMAAYAPPPARTLKEITTEYAQKMLRFNRELKTEMIAENMALGISAIPNGRNLCDIAFDPAYTELDKCKYPEALAALAALKADTSKHVNPIITPARITYYSNRIQEFLINL
jgi:hypothetical protein